MKRIKITRKTVDIEGVPTTFVTTNCPCRPGNNVGSMTCRRCWGFKGYDAGKDAAILCSEKSQTLGQYVPE